MRIGRCPASSENVPWRCCEGQVTETRAGRERSQGVWWRAPHIPWGRCRTPAWSAPRIGGGEAETSGFMYRLVLSLGEASVCVRAAGGQPCKAGVTDAWEPDRTVGVQERRRGAEPGATPSLLEPRLLLFSPATTQSRARHPLFGADVRSLLLVLSNCPSGRKYHVSFACETLGPPRRDGMTRCSVFVLFDSYLESPLIGEAFLRCIKRDGSLREIAIPNAGSPLIKPLLVRC